jgi:hypothetical protein
MGSVFSRADLQRVIYDPQEQEALVEPAVTAALRVVDEADGDAEGEVARAFLELMACLKHPAFHEEKEWRFVVLGGPAGVGPELRFAPSRFGISPYLELAHYAEPPPEGQPLPLPICHVVAGPRVMGGVEGIYLALQSKGYWARHEALEDAIGGEGVFLSKSAASYR